MQARSECNKNVLSLCLALGNPSVELFPPLPDRAVLGDPSRGTVLLAVTVSDTWIQNMFFLCQPSFFFHTFKPPVNLYVPDMVGNL